MISTDYAVNLNLIITTKSNKMPIHMSIIEQFFECFYYINKRRLTPLYNKVIDGTSYYSISLLRYSIPSCTID